MMTSCACMMAYVLCLNDGILCMHDGMLGAIDMLDILLDGGHFGHPLTVADTGTISHASISENVHSK